VNARLPDHDAPAALRRVRPRARAMAQATAKPRHNWLLYAFLFLLPLQNLQTGYMPNLGGGLNFLNVGFLLALIGAWTCRGTITRWSGVQRWILAYVIYACLSLIVGYSNISGDTSDHFSVLKDSILAVMLVFLVQMSVTDASTLRRVIVVTLLPLPYMLRVMWSQHSSVSSWHYSDNLRVSGTFSMLGANEFAAFCVTMSILILALLLAAPLSRTWRAGLAMCLGCMVLCVVWAYSRTAYIALLLGAGAVALVWRGRWKMVVPLFVAALLLPVLMPASVVERFDSTTIEQGKRDESTEMRFEFWAIAWQNFTEHPLLGSGFNTFHHAEINPHQMDAHNFFMRELTEKGLVGLMITIGMLISIFRACWRAMKHAPARTFAYALALGMIGAWLALILGNCFGDRFTYYPMIGYFWVYLGLTLKARELLDSEAAATPQADAPARRRPLRRHVPAREAVHG